MTTLLIPIGIAVVAVIALIIFFCSIYKVADIDKALIITGGKEPIIKVSGGSFVIPIFRKASFFDLCMLTVKADKDEIKTITAVPIVADWTAQIRPDVANMDNLKKAIMSFKERGQAGIIEDVKLTLTGAVRNIVASMTPEAVLRDKAEFEQKVRVTVADEMKNMGMELVSLNMQEVTDRNSYYNNIAAIDMEDKRFAAENKHADIEQAVRQKKALAEENASKAELDSQLSVAEKQRDNDLKRAGFKAETDRANADAQIAGELQTTIRQQEIAQQQGRIRVVEQEQANLAAQEEAKVIATKAQADKERARIKAEGDADVQRISAESRVKVAEREANAIKITANANAEKTRQEGDATISVARNKGMAEAEVAKERGLAEAEIIRQRGLAEAEVARTKGLAEAEVERTKLMAQADGEKALAEARASNDKVNFDIEKLRIEANARISIATETANIMAVVGKNAEFVNIGGAAAGNMLGGAGTGNVLFDTLSGIPALMKLLNAENQALNGRPFNEETRDLVDGLVGPAKGLLVNSDGKSTATDGGATENK